MKYGNIVRECEFFVEIVRLDLCDIDKEGFILVENFPKMNATTPQLRGKVWIWGMLYKILGIIFSEVILSFLLTIFL